MGRPFTCPHHDVVIEPDNDDGCPACIDACVNGPHPLTMTPNERVAEMERLVNPVTVNVPLIMRRLSELVGREIYTHEIGLRWDELRDEARNRTGDVPMSDIVNSLRRDAGWRQA